MNRKNIKRRMKSAVAYVRISAEHQQCSASNQMRAIRKSAKRRGFEIVKQFSDGSKIQTGSRAT
jgi:DNA invertase Pin-like site-specific DNA recombinase